MLFSRVSVARCDAQQQRTSSIVLRTTSIGSFGVLRHQKIQPQGHLGYRNQRTLQHFKYPEAMPAEDTIIIGH